MAHVCRDGGRLKGVVSVIDISRTVGQHAQRAAAMPVEAVMTTSYISCRLDDEIEETRRYVFGVGYH